MAAPAPSRFAPGRASDGSVLVQGPSAGLPSPKGSHPSGGHIGDEAHSHAHKKSLGKSFTSFFKGLFSSSSSSSKSKDAIHNSHSSALDASREGPQKSSKSLTAAISPVSTLSPQASYNKHADLDHASSSITAVAAVTASPYSKSQSCSVAAHKSNTLHQELLNGTVAAAPGPTSPDTRKISSRSALQGFGDSLDSLTLRQPSRTFMELRAQAQVIPTKGNQLLAVCPNLPAKMNRAIWTMKDYAIVEKMYKGYASTVYKAFCKRSGELVCLKAYDMANLCELNRFQIYREVQLHARLQHQNVITLFGAFQQDNQVVLVQEFADGGDLFTLLHRYGGRLPERQAVEMVLQPFLTVLHYLHQQGILHRDLKPENILFTRTLGLKLCDFGLAIDLRDERAVTRAGTLEYMAPEVLKCPFKNKPEENKEANRYYYDISVDAWAVGVLIYELLVGFPPFNDKNRPAVEEKIRVDTPRFPTGMSEGARSFISWVLQKDPAERPTIVDMMHHPFGQSTQRPLAPAPAGRNKSKGPIPALVDDDLDTVIRPKNAMQSFTAGKAPQVSNKAMQSQSRHMELPHLNVPAAGVVTAHCTASPSLARIASVSSLTESSSSLTQEPNTPTAVKALPKLPAIPPGMSISRTASVPHMVHVRPQGIVPNAGQPRPGPQQ